LVIELRAQRLLTVFYNMHKSTHRALCTMLSEDEFICCQSEGQVYNLIQSNRLDRPGSADPQIFVHPERVPFNASRIESSLSSSFGTYGSLDRHESDVVSRMTVTLNCGSQRKKSFEVKTVAIINHDNPTSSAESDTISSKCPSIQTDTTTLDSGAPDNLQP
jgi:hypothetical protein